MLVQCFRHTDILVASPYLNMRVATLEALGIYNTALLSGSPSQSKSYTLIYLLYHY